MAAPAFADSAGLPALQPDGDPAPFAESSAAVAYWPVVTARDDWDTISYQRDDGAFAGAELRRFNAPRPAARADNPTRRHVGVDIYARAGDAVVAVEDGRIVGFYPFLRAATGEMSWAILAAHGAYAAIYGEVRETSLSARNLAIGAAVIGGQPIGEISDTAQLHFETYLPGTTRNQSWAHGAARPSRVLNPTRLLLRLAREGRRLRPALATAAVQ